MTRTKVFQSFIFTLVLALFWGLVSAQGPVNPAAPVQPAQPPQQPQVAMVRLAQFVPNAPAVDVTLAGKGDKQSSLAPDAFKGLGYGKTTDYTQVPAGGYTITATAQGKTVLKDEVNFSAGNYYTVAAIGLVLPGENPNAEAEGGFFNWVNNLFGGGEKRDALALQFKVYNDDLYTKVDPGKVRLRVVNAAPGSPNFDVVVNKGKGASGGAVSRSSGGDSGGASSGGAQAANQGEVLFGNLAFADAGGYKTLDAGITGLELHVAGSKAVALDLSQVKLAADTINTVFIIGTPIKSAPLKAVEFTKTPQTRGAAMGAVSGVSGGVMSGAAEANEVTYY